MYSQIKEDLVIASFKIILELAEENVKCSTRMEMEKTNDIERVIKYIKGH